MTRVRSRHGLVSVISAILALVVSVFAGGGLTVSASHAAMPASRAASKHGPPYTIYLSNTVLNNGWRLEMQSIAHLFSQTAPYNHLINLRIVNAPNDVSSQIASLNAMIPAHPDAILIDADSPTALNPVINRAISAGIKVLSFDNLVDNPKVYNLTISGGLVGAAYTTALWLARSMHGKGNVVINNGVMGTDGEAQQNKGVKMALAKYPSIKIIDEFSGQWATAPSEAGFARILATHPKIDGVWDSGGEIGVIQALQNAHRPLIPVAGFTFNRYFQLCVNLKGKGLQCAAASNPCTLSAMAMTEALDLLQGKMVPHTVQIPYTFYSNNGVPSDKPTVPIIAGKTTFAGLPDEFSFPYNPPGVKLDPFAVSKGMH